MSESNSGGRNQKLVIDYLEALLSDSDDEIIEIEQELAATVNRDAERELSSRQSAEKQASEEESVVQELASQNLEVTPAVAITEDLELIVAELTADDIVAEISAAVGVASDNMQLDAIAAELPVDNLDQDETKALDLNCDLPATVADVETDIEIESTAESKNLTSELAESDQASMDSEPLNDEQSTAVEPALEPYPENSAVPEIEAHSSSDVELASGVEQEMEVIPEAQSLESELSINCIIVLMYGLKLAIPFEDIEGLIKLSNVTLSLDNDRNWILGDFRSATMCTHVVDTAQILFGDNYDPLNSNYNEMLVLAGKHWSIVFDKIIKAQNILLSDVTENPSPQFRPWLTGTYLAEKCALVNVAAMVKMFDDELNS
ncbi:MAG: hypothetical protein OFPII_23190 [Osedax symbiont Rs1]|nr:MAG: hypothetical protein OFPII_23190 [Osedax symbiont Rs1]